MAGNYPDAPSRRMGIDADGTVGFTYTSAASTELSAGAMTSMNSESGAEFYNTGGGNSYNFGILFPEPREIDGLFLGIVYVSGSPTWSGVYMSGDTTNGRDGTWNLEIANFPEYYSTYTQYRDNIYSLAVAAQRGIRSAFYSHASSNNGPAAFHVYGTISPGSTPDRILFLDTLAADAEFTKVLDFGDVPRGQTITRTFKIKNNSSTLSINTITVAAEDLYLNAGGWYTFGDDDITYVASFSAGNLAALATKLIYLKQVVPDTETLGLQTGRIKVSHANLT